MITGLTLLGRIKAAYLVAQFTIMSKQSKIMYVNQKRKLLMNIIINHLINY